MVQVLTDVVSKLTTVEAIQSVEPNWAPLGGAEEPQQIVQEQVEIMANFDTEDKEDGDKAAEQARQIKVEFSATDVKFWFSQLEDEMLLAGIGKQWLKKTVLQRNLPVKQKEDVKTLLTKQQTDAGSHIYLDIKNELIRIYAPKPEDSYIKALGRSMVGLPSQLGYQVIDDICTKSTKLSGCCCAGAAKAIWSTKLPANVRSHISGMAFNHTSFKAIFEAADQCYLSSQQINVAALTVDNLDETQSAFTTQNQPSQVAAVRSNKPNRGNKPGKQPKPKKQRDQSKRHSSNPPDSVCDRHFYHGSGAWYCLAPSTCPWAKKTTPKQ